MIVNRVFSLADLSRLDSAIVSEAKKLASVPIGHLQPIIKITMLTARWERAADAYLERNPISIDWSAFGRIELK